MSSLIKTPELPHRAAVIGAGAWGTALAAHLALKGLEITLWAYEPEVADDINRNRRNSLFLPDIDLPLSLRATNDLKEAVSGQKVALMVTPSHVMRGVARLMAAYLSPGVALISASKGIENDSLVTMCQVLAEEVPPELGAEIGVLSGPSFARETALGLPAAVTLAWPDREAGKILQSFLAAPTFRIYTSSDITGVELGGALKNVYALAAGVCDGLDLGSNARAALLTRALSEMSRAGLKLGANPLTFMGLAGLGDLILTATGDLSRNRQVGLRLGRGEKLADIIGGARTVAEGVKTARAVWELAIKYEVSMPMAKEMYRVLYDDKSPRQAMVDLLTRRLKDEFEYYPANLC